MGDGAGREVTADTRAHRPVRSYVLREGRLTDGQRRALEELFPRYGIALKDGAPDWKTIFGRDAPLHLEIGFGDGGALLEMAEKNPAVNFIGVEVHRPGVGRLLLQLESRGIENVRVFCADAVEVLTVIADQSLAAVYLYFPDPWHKKKHHKRRLVQTQFVHRLADKLITDGILHFATDWLPYAEHTLECITHAGRFQNTTARFADRPPSRPLTKFEQRGQRLGNEVWDVVMRKIN